MAAKRSRRAAARKRAPRERLPVIEVDVDDEEALSAVAEQVAAAIFELRKAPAAKPRKGVGPTSRKKPKRAKPKRAKPRKSKAKRGAVSR
jgi:hypothetical protein